MYIDPRVAHGKTRFELAEMPILHGRGRTQDLIASVNRVMEGSSRLGSREYARRLQRKAIPELRRMGAVPFVGNESNNTIGGIIGALYFTQDDRGVQLKRLVWTAGDRCSHDFLLMRFEPHALARCMQRNGVLSLPEIALEVNAAAAFALPLLGAAAAENWTQVGLPTPSGIFVGNLSKGFAVMQTYFCPGQNGRTSRWSGYREFFKEAVAAVQADTHCGPAIAAVFEAAKVGGGVAARFPFLMDSHEYTPDPDDTIWDQARASAARPEDRHIHAVA
ncbi:hypothetical protein [Paraburkholderia sp. SIMBA_054]|uniref:hypothetical protein n=1 Tax=Paraburkholderia sp. SIMBA_054 TaxID=3085795 RepID=UPI00397D6687